MLSRGTTLRLSSSSATTTSSATLQNFNPNNYNIPLRPANYNDLMEPYGSFQVALEAERRLANRYLLIGALCFSGAMTFFLNSGAVDGIMMPNLDNIMEETESIEHDKEGRFTV